MIFLKEGLRVTTKKNNIVVSLIISIVTIIVYFSGLKSTVNDTFVVVNTLIAIFSILFSIFGVTISIVAALIDKDLFKKLFAKESYSKEQLIGLNKLIIFTFFFNLTILLLIQLFKSIILEFSIVSFICISIVTFFSSCSLFSLIGFYRIITKALFNVHN
ncbi:Uncharacterised protein [Staphylococcus aureus]|nr:Uncharacterised protein [Staphylococcus aureus]